MKVLMCLLTSLVLCAVVASPIVLAEPLAKLMQEEQERNPRLSAALEQMRVAKQELEETSSDLSGHKSIAIHALDEAINQLQITLELKRKEDKNKPQ